MGQILGQNREQIQINAKDLEICLVKNLVTCLECKLTNWVLSNSIDEKK